MTTATASGRRVTPTARLILPADAPRDQWLAERTRGVGSSDAPAILGVDDYRSPLHVYYDKRGELPDDAGEPAYWGTQFEDPVARHWAMVNRSVIRRIGLVAHVEHDWQRTTLDRRVTECPLSEGEQAPCALEVKCRSAFKSAQWHAGCPDDVLAQMLWQIIVNGYEHMHYAVLIGGNEYRQGTVRADDHRSTMADILTAVERFWTGNVLAGVAPEHSGEPERTVEMYRRMHPDRSGALVLDGYQAEALEVLEDYEQARLAEAAARKRKNAAKARALRLLGDHREATLSGAPVFSMEPNAGRPTTDYDLLAERWPDAYAACVTCKPGERFTIADAYRLRGEGGEL